MGAWASWVLAAAAAACCLSDRGVLEDEGQRDVRENMDDGLVAGIEVDEMNPVHRNTLTGQEFERTNLGCMAGCCN